MDTPFLIISLFFPRVVLFIYYAKGWIPTNTVPLLLDVLLAVFIPRLLILIYIYQTLGTGSVWFWIHLIALLLAFSGGGTAAKKRKRKKERS